MRPPSGRDAAITGTGVFTPLGHGLEATWDALAAGARATPPQARVAEPFLRVAVPEDLDSQSKFLNGAGRLASEVVALAIAGARLAASGASSRYDATRRSLYLAALDLTLADFEAYYPSFSDITDRFTHAPDAQARNVATQRKMSPFYLLETLNNNAFSFLSAWHDLRGSNTSVSGWGGPGLLVVSLAARAVARGDAAAAVACGVGRGTGAVVQLEFERMGLLPKGVVPGEGAGAIVVESLDDARGRGAPADVVVLGSCATSGAGDKRSAAALAAASAACEEAGMSSPDAGSLWGPDPAVAPVASISPRVPVVDTRRATGEMGAGSETSDVALAARALARGTLPDGRPAGRSALVLTSGVEGQTVAVVLARVG